MADPSKIAVFFVRDLAVSLYKDQDTKQWLVMDCGAVSIGTLTCQETKKPHVQVELQRGGDAELIELRAALKRLVTITETLAE